jgi:hypothetical protein
MMDPASSETCWSNFNVWFILEFYVTQILIFTTSRFECISRLIKVTDNNDARWKLEIEINRCFLPQKNICTIFLNHKNCIKQSYAISVLWDLRFYRQRLLTLLPSGMSLCCLLEIYSITMVLILSHWQISAKASGLSSQKRGVLIKILHKTLLLIKLRRNVLE